MNLFLTVFFLIWMGLLLFKTFIAFFPAFTLFLAFLLLVGFCFLIIIIEFFAGKRHTRGTPSRVEVARGKRTRASSQRITRNAFFIKCFIYESHTLQFFTLNQFTTQTGISRGIVVTPSSNTFLLG